MLKVYSITALALVQAFVLFIGPTNVSSTSSSVAPSQTNASSIPHCQTVCHQVTNVTSNTSATVSSSTSVIVSSITLAIVNVSTCSIVCSTTDSQQLSSSNTAAPTQTSSDTVTLTSPPSYTATPTLTSPDTVTPTPHPSNTATPTPTSSDTVTPTPPPSDTPTPTPTSSDIVTTTPPTSSSFTSQPSFSSSVVSQTPGSTVIICLLVKVSYCNDTLYGNTSSSESQALLANITTNVINVFAKENVTVIEVELVSITCVSSTYVLVFVRVTFKLGIKAGFVIESHLKEEIKNKSLGDLPVNNTHSNVTFEGVTLTYEIKGGECQRVCCGAGGSVVLVQKCTPSSKCQGILAKEKEEAGHCHGEQNDLCTGNAICTTTASDITPSPSKASPCTVTMSTTPDKDAKCSDWEAVDNQCKKCTEGGAGPFKIKRKCTVENQNSCDYVINEETDSTDCLKYCDSDGSSHSPPSVSLVLLLTIATAFRYTVY